MLAKPVFPKGTLILAFLLCSFVSFSQKTVTGTVLDTDSKPLSGVTVKAKGSETTVTTNDNGKFSINVPATTTELELTSVGFAMKTISIAGQSDISITLDKQVSNLDEVVVIGYSSQRKKEITGAVTVVNVADLKTQPSSDPASQLQGRASGVTVVQSGVPGDGATVRIRGLGSFTNNNPLYVVDGVQTSNITGLNPNDIESMQVLKDAASAAIYGIGAANGVIVVTTKRGKTKGVRVGYDMYYGIQDPGKGPELLNAQEEAELYFLARRNSGLATTGSVYGNGATPVLPDYLYYTGASNDGVPINAGNPNVNPSLYELNNSRLGETGYNPYLIVPAAKGGTNWYDVVTRTAPIQNHNLSLSGSNEGSRFLLSMNYFNQDAITRYQYYKRYTARLNSEFNVLKFFRVGENLQVFASESNTPGNGDNENNNTEASVIAQTFRPMAIMPVYQIDGQGFAGNKGGPGQGTWGNAKNPLAGAFRKRKNKTTNQNLFGNVYAELDITKHLMARTSFGGNINSQVSYRYPFIEYEYTENTGNTTYNEGSRKDNNWIWTNTLSYRNTIGDHNFSVLGGYESQKGGGRQIVGAATGFFNYSNYDFINLGNGAVQNLSGSQTFTPVARQSYFGNLNYAYANKYLVTANFRADGSSKFIEPNNYGYFPSFSVGWRITEEAFMKNVTWLNDLKLRGSWGKVGTEFAVNSGNAFTTFSSNRQSSWYDIFGAQNAPAEGFFLSFLGNPAGQWEKSVSTNIGFDATLFHGSTEVVFDYYNKKTEGLLYNPEQQAIAGAAASQALRNVGSMENHGFDILISNKANISKDSRLTTSLTFTTYKNKINSIANGLTFFNFNSGTNEANRIGQNATRNIVGQPLNTYFGYQVIGLFQDAAEVASAPTQDQAAPGRFRYADINDDKVIDDKDRTVIGNPNPKFSYGLNVGYEYKAFDVSAFFYGVAGKDAFNFTKWWTDFTPGGFPGGRSKDALYDSWLADGSRPGAKTPIQDVSSGNGFSTSGQVNSYYVEDASYFRLRNLQIGYTLPAALTGKANISRVRVYIQAANLFTITKYSGLNPDIISSDDRAASVDVGAYPVVRQYLLGASITF
ncbi:MAG: TonB-dependent receptor [Chitinophagaceae bacterium]|nr:MAG: TonB-dependent receptor [Chitinophagaceae bacterium]